MAQTKIGAMKSAAKKKGIPFEEYKKRIDSGQKHCMVCRVWKPREGFDIDRSRGDGRTSACIECRRVENPYSSLRGRKHTEEHREKITNGLLKFYEDNPGPGTGKPSPQRGAKRTKEQRENIRLGKLKNQTYGKDNHSYVDGRTEETRLLRKDNRYREWRRQVYGRDNYTCRDCGDSTGGNLNAHHIKPWHDYPELRYEISNGLTLCEPCHIERHR